MIQESSRRLPAASVALLCVPVAVAACLVVAGCSTDPNRGKEMYLQSGLRYMQKGKYQESIIQFRNALKLDPKYTDAYVNLGEAHLANQEWSNAFAVLQHAMELEPMRADVRLSLGRLYISARDSEKAEQEATAVLEHDANNVGAYQLLGAALLVKQDYGRAGETFGKLVKLTPNDGNAHMNLALVQLSLGHQDSAEEEFRKALDLDPHSTKTYVNFANFYRLVKQPDRAFAIVRQGVEANPADPQLTFMLADLFYGRQQAGEAGQVLDRLRGRLGNSAQAALAIGDYYAARHMEPLAGAEYERALKEAPGNLEVKRHLVAWLLSASKVDQAEALNNQVLAERPKDGPAGIAKGRLLLAHARNDEAITELRRQVALDPKSTDAHFYLAMAYQQSGSLGQARDELIETLKLTPEMPAGLRGLAELSLAMHDTRSAVQTAQRAVQISPLNAAEHGLLGRAYLSDGDSVKAEKEYLLAQRINPSDGALAAGLAQAYLAQNKWNEAEKELSLTLQINPDATPALAELASEWSERKQMQKALSRVESYAAAHPSDARAHLLLGSLELTAKRYDLASKSLSHAAELDPALVDAHLRLGQLEQERGNTEAAIHHYEAALALAPRMAPLHTLLGNLYLHLGRIEQARGAYRQALVVDPSFAVAAGNLAWLEAEHGGDLNVALSLAQRARQLLPTHLAIADSLAWINYKQGVYSSSIELLRECVQKAPSSSLYRYHLGMALLASGDKVHARTELHTALDLRLAGADATRTREALSSIDRQ